ncbi:metalloregulator ArsR/SmtB family transcription factor [Pontibacter sp. JAM-7]|uniref:metalloregulator ArsR/SmtB family transcription factor n=1 Tax=Pontibacter sp. JAM-7 TaxID=3366581 RepID=UPI003AF99C68
MNDSVPFFKAMADATRLQVILLVSVLDELCVCELTARLQLSQPKISRHLALLRTTGLLQDERRGQWVFYRLHPALPDWCKQVIAAAAQNHSEWLQQQQAIARQLNCCD